MKKVTLLFLAFLSMATWVIAQDPRLAFQYFENGEYEKAAGLLENLYQRNPGNDQYLNKYLECLNALGKFSQCEDVLKNEIKKRPQEVQLYVIYGNLLLKKGDESRANKQFQQAIDKLPPDVIYVHKLGNAFIENLHYDLAIETYEKANKILKGSQNFTYNLADLYRRKGDQTTMLKYYLDGLENGSINVDNLQNILIVYLPQNKYEELQSLLYERLQNNPDQIPIISLLQWSFIQQKDYLNALRQAKALDKQTGDRTAKIFEIASTAANDADYKTAIDGFSYIKSKGISGSYYFESARQELICRRKQVVEKNDYNKEDLLALEREYDSFLKENSNPRLTASIIIEYAELEARYLNNLPKAIQLLDDLVKIPTVEIHERAQAKLDLADYYLISGERWEATLLYSQVDKDFLEDQLGEMARFKNARLSYFAGDFHWAQEQFDILKQATSHLISNDAIDVSVFISDNLNQDSTGAALLIYSQAELKVFQNQFDSALILLDTLLSQYPKNSLEDDVFYLQGRIYNRIKMTDLAISKFDTIINNFKESIRADNAIYELAKMYDYQLNNKEKAKELYEKLFLDFSGSILAIEAKKRFRTLRGDKVVN